EHLRRDAHAAKQKAEHAITEREAILKAREATECDMVAATALISEIRQSAQAHHDEVAVKRAEKAAMAERLSGAMAIATRVNEEREELLARLSSLSAQQTAIQA